MAASAEKKVQTALRGFINDVDKTHLRCIERLMHLCAANCCANRNADIDNVHRCVVKCQQATKKKQDFVQTELERFRESLNRCVLSCQGT
jgi:hypothetical protein